MHQKGFANIVLVLIVVALVGAGAYIVLTQQTALFQLSLNSILSQTPTSTSNQGATPTSTSEQPPQNENVLSVVDLTSNKEVYVGKRVSVQGRIAVDVFYGERSCTVNDPACDTTMGARLELWQPNTISGAENFLLIFAKNQPYACNKTAPETYACPPYINNQITTVEGVWSKDQVPIQWVGSSAGGPATPLKWEDRYFLNIE